MTYQPTLSGGDDGSPGDFRCELCNGMIAAQEDDRDIDELVKWIEIEDEQEAEKLAIAPAPIRPPPAEVADHEITHLPYRSWCDACARGRGLGEQRGRHAGRPHGIPRVGVDYWFITRGGLFRRSELDYPETPEGQGKLDEDRRLGKVMKCIIVRCHESKAVFAHAIPCKGPDEDGYVVDLVVSDVVFMGHTKLILKSDNEVSLLALVAQALMAIRCEANVASVTSEQAQEYESASNGGTETGIRHIRGLFRTLKICTEKRIGQEIPPMHPVSCWLVEHAAILITAINVGPDGKTAWARLRGRGFGQRLVGFLEGVYWKQPAGGPQHDPQGNMGPRQHPGIFLGYHKTSNSYRVATNDGNVIKTRSILRRPYADRWRAEDIKAITATPWSLRAPKEPVRVDLGEAVPRHEPQPTGDLPVPRRLKITMKLLNEFGTTDNCPQCVHVRAFGEAKPGLAHTEICRKRLADAMAATDAGAAHLERHDTRTDRLISLRIEAADEEIARRRAEAQPAPQNGTGASSSSDAGTQGAGHGTSPAAEDGAVGSTGASSSGIPRDEHGMPIDMPTDGGDQEMAMTVEELMAKLSAASLGLPGPRSCSVPCKVEDDDQDIVSILAVLGADPKSFRREKKQAVRRIVSEVYSPPRVTSALKHMTDSGLMPGVALDITTADPADGEPWDFDRADKRKRARELLRQQRPLFLIGSPMCTRWCSWQRLNDLRRDPGVVQREKVRAAVHLEFVCELYRDQIEDGRFFLHEHPEGAGSWEAEPISQLLLVPGVERVTADQCQYGQQVNFGTYKGRPVKKPTGFMSNAPHLLVRLSRRCAGRGGECTRRAGGRHATASGKIAKEAAKYTRQLCRAIVHGMTDEMYFRGIWKRGEVGLHAVTDEDVPSQVPNGCSGRYHDDLTGQPLRDELVVKARAKELQYFHDKGVWVKRPRGEAHARTGKGAISVRWVDVNKGDDFNPRYRSRLVARQLKAHDKSGSSFFAPTPPLEALRTALSLAATTVGTWRPCRDPESEERTQILILDISRAYFNARLDPGQQTYVQLPSEDPDAGHMCAKLLRHMYGTRAAADGWQEEYSTFLVEMLKFRQGISSPCVFRHSTRQLVVTVHGDDFTSVGAKRDLDWFEAAMEENYELTKQPRLGPGPQDAKEATVLNRVIRWTDEGLEYEADPRQSEKLIEECGLTGVNTVATPGVRLSFDQVERDPPLPAHLHTAFRGSAARANYLAADRPDCQFAAKEICRWMAAPTEGSWNALKRLCRYLVGLPRLIFSYSWQTVDAIDIYTDTDWAGCPRTRKSTSCGAVLFGGHTIKSWSSTQSSVALSSGEAEFNGVVRGSGVGLGYQSLLSDLGVQVPVRVWTDSSAAVGICSRQGLGKLRHLDTHTLWAQQAVRSHRIDLRKVAGEVNPADLFTKHSLSRDRLGALVELFSCRFQEGRAESAPKVRQTPSSKRTMATHDGHEVMLTQGENRPIMPHRMYDVTEMNRRYPRIGIHDAQHDHEDLVKDEEDTTLQAGMKIAESIQDTAKEHGRRRLQR